MDGDARASRDRASRTARVAASVEPSSTTTTSRSREGLRGDARERALEVAAGVEDRHDDRDAGRRRSCGRPARRRDGPARMGACRAAARAGGRRRARGRRRSRAPPGAAHSRAKRAGSIGSRGVYGRSVKRGAVVASGAPERAQEAAVPEHRTRRRLAARPVAREEPARASGARREHPVVDDGVGRVADLASAACVEPEAEVGLVVHELARGRAGRRRWRSRRRRARRRPGRRCSRRTGRRRPAGSASAARRVARGRRR